MEWIVTMATALPTLIVMIEMTCMAITILVDIPEDPQGATIMVGDMVAAMEWIVISMMATTVDGTQTSVAGRTMAAMIHTMDLAMAGAGGEGIHTMIAWDTEETTMTMMDMEEVPGTEEEGIMMDMEVDMEADMEGGATMADMEADTAVMEETTTKSQAAQSLNVLC